VTTYLAEVRLYVRVQINDPDVITRCVEDHDGWRTRMYYDLETLEQVIEHLAYNCARNHIEEVSRLDGWADLPDSAASMRITDAEVENVEVVEP